MTSLGTVSFHSPQVLISIHSKHHALSFLTYHTHCSVTTLDQTLVLGAALQQLLRPEAASWHLAQ